MIAVTADDDDDDGRSVRGRAVSKITSIHQLLHACVSESVSIEKMQLSEGNMNANVRVVRH